MSSSYSLDVEQFISEIEKRPVIWDFNCEDNRHKNRKERAWDEVARKFIRDYEEMSSTERMDVYRKLFGKWRNIRDSYVRDVKKKNGNKRYMYSKHLSFLNPLYKPNENQTDDDEWSEDGESKKRSQSVFNETDCWQSGSENSVDDTRIKKIKKEENPLQFLETPLIPDAPCNFSVEDEDRSFFDSLLPAVRSFNLDQKLEFRSEVLTLIKKFRNAHKNDVSLTIEFDN